MDSISGFLMTHGQLHSFDDSSQALPPYPGFVVPKKANH